eukprot:1195814-Prorocentrum_minimum.AAC.8
MRTRRCPLVIFAHSLGGLRIQNTALLEELASRGYVCVAADFPYDASLVVFPDGQQAPFIYFGEESNRCLPQVKPQSPSITPNHFRSLPVTLTSGRPPSTPSRDCPAGCLPQLRTSTRSENDPEQSAGESSSPVEFFAANEGSNARFPQELLDFRQRCIRHRTADIDFIRRKLADMHANPAESLFGAMDVSRPALIGHSYGGGTVVEAARSSPASAVVMLDGQY